MLQFIKERLNDYDVSYFVNELFEASKELGRLEAKIDSYRFNSILVPMLHKKEAISSMYIEGTQTTISDVFENEVSPKSNPDKTTQEVENHSRTLVYGADFLRTEDFSNAFIQKLHELMLTGIINKSKEETLGRYKTKKNFIVNSVGTVVFEPPSEKETKKYMDELITFMNDMNDGINPLIKAAIIHSQFESIHPFEDGNGRVGRLLVSLYLFKSKVINVPFFYISEAISQDKAVYYNKLTDTRRNNYNEWIKFFLQKIIVQTSKHIKYIDTLNQLYEKTKKIVQESTKSAKCDDIVECLFTHPVLTSSYLSKRLDVSIGQAKRYLNILEEKQVLMKNDRQRNQMFYFVELLDMVRSY
ncbi:MAG: Fic family protein [Lachnospiraceae bacterium]